MEPVTIVVLLGLAAAAVAVVAFWGKIVSWAHDALFPWVSANIPSAVGLLKQAFVVLDKAVVAVRKVAIQAWRKIREFLLKQALRVFRKDGEWYRSVESWLVSEETEKVTKVTTEEEVEWEELPDDIREELMRRNGHYDVNVTSVKDDEADAMAMAM